MISIEHVTKRYGKVLANKDVSFEAKDGEITVLLGPNDAGKSTLLKSICGLLRFEGLITVNGHNNHTSKAKRTLGYMSEIPILYPTVTVAEHLEFIANAYCLEPDQWQSWADDLLKRFELEDKRDQLVEELPKDLQKRLSICCALVPKPRNITLDEPFVGLGAHAVSELKKLISELKSDGCALLISAQTTEDIRDWDATYTIKQGALEKTSSPEGAYVAKATTMQALKDGIAPLKKTRVGKTGIKGWGASAFFSKHLRELFREHPLGFFSASSFITLAITALLAFFLGGVNTTLSEPDTSIGGLTTGGGMGVVMLLPLLMLLQFMFNGTGRGVKELRAPYIFLAPSPSGKKLVFSNLVTFIKISVEGVIYLGIAGILMHENPFVVIAAIVAYVTLAPFLLNAHYVSLRLTQAGVAQGVLVVLSFVGVLVLWAPGFAGSMALGFLSGQTTAELISLAVLIAWQVLIAAILYVPAKKAFTTTDITPSSDLRQLEYSA